VNQKAQQQRRDAQTIAMQRAVAQAPQGGATTRPAQAMAGTVQQATGQQHVQQVQQVQQQQAQVGNMAVKKAASDIQNRLEQLKQGQQGSNLQENQRLFNQQQQLENSLFNERIQFRRDELGRLELNDRQLADYARLSGASDEQMRDYMQYAQLAHQRDMDISRHVSAMLEENLRFESSKRMQDQDQELVRRLSAEKKAMDEKIARKQAEIKNNSQIWSTVLGVVGGVVGGYFGGPQGAMAGYSGGSAIGSAAGTEMTDPNVSGPTESEIQTVGRYNE
jgi:hypothetical protein